MIKQMMRARILSRSKSFGHQQQRLELIQILGAARLRPTVAPRILPSTMSIVASRPASSSVPQEPPKAKAQSIIDSLPGSSLASKTAILSSAAALSVYAISNEYYVVNEESVVAFCLLSVWAGLIKFGGPMYTEWADAQNDKIKNILNAARADHTQAVKNRIDNVQQMGGVVDITKSLFAVSKVRETVLRWPWETRRGEFLTNV